MADITVTIPSGGTTSNAALIGSGPFITLGLYIPAVTTSTAVIFTVANKVSDTFVPLHDAANARVTLTITAGAARAVPLDPTTFGAWACIKCVVADAQSGAKNFTFITR
jgi:hypothetical protein